MPTALTRYRALLLLLLLIAAGCAGKRVPEVRGPEHFYEKGQEALEKKRYLEAIENFQRLVSNFPGSALVADAQYGLAESYFGMEDFVNAVFEYQRLIDTYPSSEWADEASYQIGESYYQQRRRAELDQSETYEALTAYRRFIADHPDSPMVTRAQERIDECRDRLAHKDYLSARLYHRMKHYKAARMGYDQLLLDFPDTEWYWHGLAWLGRLDVDEGNLDDARRRWTEVLEGTRDNNLRADVVDWRAELDAAP